MLELPRSTASVYCTRSFVPMLKKSTYFASSGVMTAAAGVSTMMPTCTFSENALPSCESSSFASSTNSRTFLNSATLMTIGAMIAALP